jgi:hypothetical protein
MLAEAVQQRRPGGWFWDQAVCVALRRPEWDVVLTLEQIRDRVAISSESKPLHVAIHHCPGSQQFERQAVRGTLGGIDRHECAAIGHSMHEMHMCANVDMGQETSDLFVYALDAKSIENFKNPGAETAHRTETRQMVIEQKMRQFVGNRKTLLGNSVGSVNEDDAVPESTDQARAQWPVLNGDDLVAALPKQPFFR